MSLMTKKHIYIGISPRIMKKKIDKDTSFPEKIYAEASVKSIGGVSIFDFSKIVSTETVSNFYSNSDLINEAVNLLRAEGFEILQINPITINIAGSKNLYEKVFKTHLFTEEKPVIKELQKKDEATFIDAEETSIPGLIDTSKSPLANVLEGVAINEPIYYFGPSFFAPPKKYWHLAVPGDVSVGLNADRAHRRGYTGRKIKVVMVDSGHYLHPYFVSRGYKINPVALGPAAANPTHDESGHGTGESANLFSIAPDIDFTMVKINFVNSVGAFNKAVSLKPQIISCSWGSSLEHPPLSAANQIMAAAIANAVNLGIVVVFSAGNGHWGFPGQHPDVISAGGVYMKLDGTYEATPYASGFSSKIYSGRNVPDCCGLVGLPPGASYIMLPIEPGDEIDVGKAGGTHPPQDETAKDDGWAAFSGTSAAAPQIAAICALMKQACSKLTSSEIREILKKTSHDVIAGNCSPSTGGHPATPGVDLATGNGLVDAYKATISAFFKCLVHPSPITPAPLLTVSPISSVQSEGTDSFTSSVEDLEEIIMDLMK